MWDFINAHFKPLLIAAGIVAFVLLTLSLALFYELMTQPDKTRRAVTRFVQTILGVRLALKGDDRADDALSKTITPGSVKAKDVQP